MNLHPHIFDKIPTRWKTTLSLVGLLFGITLFSSTEWPIEIPFYQTVSGGTEVTKSLWLGRYDDRVPFFAGIRTQVQTTTADPNCISGRRVTTEESLQSITGSTDMGGVSHCE